MRKIGIFLGPSAILLTSSWLWATPISSKAGTKGFTFLKISRSARAAAMGESFTALSDDINALYYNPAGLAGQSHKEIFASHILWFEAISKSSLGYRHSPFRFGTFATSLDFVAIPFEKRHYEDDSGFEKAVLLNFVPSLAYGVKATERVSLGINLKWAVEDLDTKRNSGFATDLGGLYRVPGKLNVGLSLQNIGASKIPFALRLGVAKRFLDEALIILGDLYESPADGTRAVSLGGEHKLNSFFSPRLGYKLRMTNSNFGALSGFTGGFGLRYGVYGLDYALTPYDDLGLTHRIDFLIKF